jgi:hypothetical protein
MKFILVAVARWEVGSDDPSGHGSLKARKKTKTLRKVIRAKSVNEGRKLAKEALHLFQTKLPTERQGSLSWNTAAKLGEPTFAKMIPLK